MKKITFAVIIFIFSIINCQALTNEKYYKTIYDNNVHKTEEISKEEFDSINISELSNSYIETEYKRVSLKVLGLTVELNVD